MSTASPPYRTLAEFLNRVGNIPPDRIRFDPAPGTATIQDVAEILAREGRACELVNGVLLEKPAGYRESTLAGFPADAAQLFCRATQPGVRLRC